MELCTGGDLFSYAQSLGGIVPEEQCRVIVHQILEAIKFLHSKGIAHRDIKPENTLMTRKEAGHLVVLTDFGGATYFTGSGGKMQTQVGTHGYFAPWVRTSRSYFAKLTDLENCIPLGLTDILKLSTCGRSASFSSICSQVIYL